MALSSFSLQNFMMLKSSLRITPLLTASIAIGSLFSSNVKNSDGVKGITSNLVGNLFF